MKRLLLYIFSLTASIGARAQADSLALDTVAVEVPGKVRVIQPAITLDYGKLVTTAIGWDEKYEAALSFLFFEQYYIIGEYGTGILEPESALSNGSYQSEGSYFRVGGGYFKEIKPGYRLGLGARFAQSSYSEQGEIYVESAEGIQGTYTSSYNRPDLKARWIELVLSSEAKVKLNKQDPQAGINDLFALGFHFRARIMGSYENFSPIDTYAIPGYGRALNNPNLAINLYLKIYLF